MGWQITRGFQIWSQNFCALSAFCMAYKPIKDSAQDPISTSDEDDDDVTAANRAKTRATSRKRAATELSDTDHSDEEDYGITKTKPISARARATKELDSTDSDDGGPQEPQSTEPSKRPNHTSHITGARSKTSGGAE